MATTTSRNLIRLSLGALALVGCQSFAKLDDRTADPPPPGLCALPTAGDAQLRIANFVPTDATVDFCIKPAGAASYSHPVLRNAGSEAACQDGLAYKKVTAPFAVASGTIDVKVVAAGAGGCEQTALAESLSVVVPAGSVTQLVHAGGNGEAPRVVVLREGGPASNLKVRFVNLIGGIGPLNFGLASAARVPTTMSVNVAADPIPFGATLPASAKALTGSIDELSYLSIQATGLFFGASKVGDKNAVVAIGPGRINGKFDLYAIGDPTNIRFPPRAMLCDEAATASLFVTCIESDLPSISFELYGTALYGLYAKRAAERRPVLAREVAKSDTDVLCLIDVWRKEDRQLFKDEIAKTGQFPYIATFDSNADTPISDPRDKDGKLPPAVTPVSSCGDNAALANTMINCLSNKCTTSSTPGDDAGGLNTGDCVSSECISEVVPLATGDLKQQGCFACVVFDAIAYKTYGEVKADCFNPAGGGTYFDGQNGNMILSKFPLSNVEGYVLPAVGQKRVIVSASVEYEAGKSIDVHCGVLDGILESPFNYNGPYSTAHDRQGYADEQALQAQRVTEWVKKRSGSKPAIVAVGIGSSIADLATGIQDLNPATPSALLGSFVSAEASDWTPKCTVCGAENNLCDKSQNYWEHRIFLHNIVKDAVVSSERRYMDPIVPVANSAPVPMSENFAYRVKVLRQ